MILINVSDWSLVGFYINDVHSFQNAEALRSAFSDYKITELIVEVDKK